jgi:hypothetical protein
MAMTTNSSTSVKPLKRALAVALGCLSTMALTKKSLAASEWTGSH